MPKRSANPPRVSESENAMALRLVRLATGQEVLEPYEAKPPKSAAAMELGRRGGLKGGPARAAKLTKKQLTAIGKKGAARRWGRRKEAP